MLYQLSYRDAKTPPLDTRAWLVTGRIRTGDPKFDPKDSSSTALAWYFVVSVMKKVYPTGFLTTCSPWMESRYSVTSRQGQLSPCFRLDGGIGYPQEDTEVSHMGTVCPLLTSLEVGLTPAILTLRGPTCNTAASAFQTRPHTLGAFTHPLFSHRYTYFNELSVCFRMQGYLRFPS